MSEGTTVREGWLRFLWNHKWLVIVPAIVSTLAAVAVSSRMPRRYQSQASLLVVPQRVPPDYVRPTTQVSLDDRIRSISSQILSRTRLERLIEEFNLYRQERQQMLMEDVVQRMKNDVSISMSSDGTDSGGLRVAFTGDDPRTVERVTNRLSQLFIDASVRERQISSEGTNAFLRAMIDDTKRRILEYEKSLASATSKSRVQVLEYEALQQHYKNLLLKNEEAAVALRLESAQIGEQLRLLDTAKLPEQPIGPSRKTVNLIGALSGVVVGFLLVGAQSVRDRRRATPEAHTA